MELFPRQQWQDHEDGGRPCSHITHITRTLVRQSVRSARSSLPDPTGAGFRGLAQGGNIEDAGVIPQDGARDFRDDLSKRYAAGRVEPRGRSGPAFVTFEGVGLEKRKAKGEPFAAVLAQKLGIDIIHVIPRAADWYHYPDMDACLDAVRPHVGPDTIAYGSSMGAFVAARFSDRLGIRRALCFSPQYSIQPGIVPFERRWQDHAARIDFLHDDSIAPHDATLWLFVAPEFPEEIEHVRMIAPSGPHRIVPVPFSGHPFGTALLEAGVLGEIIAMFLDGREEAGALADLVARTQDLSSTVKMGQAKKARGPEREALLRAALQLNRKNARARSMLGVFLMRTNRVEEGHKVLRPLFRPPVNPRIASMYTRACEKAGVPTTLLDRPPTRAPEAAARRASTKRSIP